MIRKKTLKVTWIMLTTIFLGCTSSYETWKETYSYEPVHSISRINANICIESEFTFTPDRMRRVILASEESIANKCKALSELIAEDIIKSHLFSRAVLGISSDCDFIVKIVSLEDFSSTILKEFFSLTVNLYLIDPQSKTILKSYTNSVKKTHISPEDIRRIMSEIRSQMLADYGSGELISKTPPEPAAKPYTEEKPKKYLPPPIIEIIYPLDKSKTKLTEIELKIRISGEGDIKKIIITVNDQESVLDQNDLRRIEEPPSEGAIRGVRTWRPKVALAEGRNVVWVQALDQSDNTAKAAVNIFREGKDTAQALKAATKVWLLAVGISQYKDAGLNLKFADKDARSFYQQLTDPQRGLVKNRDHAKLLLNEQATRRNTVDALNYICKQAFDEDLVILYFAMHGMVDPDGSELFFVAHDTEPLSLASTGVSQLEIERAISKSKSGKVLLIVDTCHSGSAGLSGVFAQRAVSTAAVSNLLLNKIAIVKKGMSIFTASSSTEFSQENQKWGGGHGVFTHYLMEGLKGAADENGDKFITLRELYDYTYRRVKEETKGNQHPEIKGTLDTNIPLAEVR